MKEGQHQIERQFQRARARIVGYPGEVPPEARSREANRRTAPAPHYRGRARPGPSLRRDLPACLDEGRRGFTLAAHRTVEPCRPDVLLQRLHIHAEHQHHCCISRGPLVGWGRAHSISSEGEGMGAPSLSHTDPQGLTSEGQSPSPPGWSYRGSQAPEPKSATTLACVELPPITTTSQPAPRPQHCPDLGGAVPRKGARGIGVPDPPTCHPWGLGGGWPIKESRLRSEGPPSPACLPARGVTGSGPASRARCSVR